MGHIKALAELSSKLRREGSLGNDKLSVDTSKSQCPLDMDMERPCGQIFL